MSIEKFVVSRDDTIYEAWPDLVLTEGGRLVCVFSECKHHGDRTDARLTYVTSDDRGRTWSEKRYLTERGVKDAYYNCTRIVRLPDGRLVITADFIEGHENGRDTQVWLWFGDAEGENWVGPIATPLHGIVPDKLLVLSTGRWFLAAHTPADDTGKLTEYGIYSDDGGMTWSQPVTVAKDARYNLCEASIVEASDGTLVCLLRENSREGIDCLKTFSRDDGETWSDVYHLPIPGCHRPTAGYLENGRLMVTYRFFQGGRGGFGNPAQTFLAAFLDENTLLATDRMKQTARIMPIDYDRSPKADFGYSGWVRFPDGEIYVVQYCMDDATVAQIRGYSFRMEDVVLG